MVVVFIILDLMFALMNTTLVIPRSHSLNELLVSRMNPGLEKLVLSLDEFKKSIPSSFKNLNFLCLVILIWKFYLETFFFSVAKNYIVYFQKS